ncbi:MAG: GNAT family N-acetyltransferase [Candidatus Promineifilaceae bacterium]
MADAPREIVVTVPDPQWVTLFREEARTLRLLFGDEVVGVHHIGSTSVPGLPAKPIIDILLEVRDIDKVDDFNPAMSQLGYAPRGEYGLPRRRYFPRLDGQRHLSHVHTWQSNDPEIERHLSFRDYLIAHPAARDEYGHLKQQLAALHRFDQESYMAGKDPFIEDRERLAISWWRTIDRFEIETPRLTLKALNPAQLLYRLSRPQQLADALRVSYVEVPVSEPVRRAVRQKARRMETASAGAIPWHTYWLIILRESRLAAGLIGFKGTPGSEGLVEIGYGVDSAARGQGYATEAVCALSDWALGQPGCRGIFARTRKDNVASIRVLRKSGFSLTGEEKDEFCWITTPNLD